MKKLIFGLVMGSVIMAGWSCATPIEPRPDVPKILVTLQDDINM